MRDNDYLMHYGILGMKWGIRRYQNYDGTLKVQGRLRYSKTLKEKSDMYKKKANDLSGEEQAKVLKKSEKLSDWSERLADSYKRSYAKTYVRELNRESQKYDNTVKRSNKVVVDSIESFNDKPTLKKVLSIGNIGKSAVNIENAKQSYSKTLNSASSDVPKYTDYKLEKRGTTSSGSGKYGISYKEAQKKLNNANKVLGDAGKIVSSFKALGKVIRDNEQLRTSDLEKYNSTRFERTVSVLRPSLTIATSTLSIASTIDQDKDEKK